MASQLVASGRAWLVSVTIDFRAVAVSRLGGAGDARRVRVGVWVRAPALRRTLPGPRTQRVGRVRFTRTRRVRARGRGVLLRRKRVGVVAFVRRRVLARRLGLAAREWRKTRSPPRATLRGRDANARATARAPKKDPFASSITIATPEFDVARERRARGATFRGRRRGEKGVVVRTGKKAGKWEAEELCLRPRTSSSAAAIVGAPPAAFKEEKF